MTTLLLIAKEPVPGRAKTRLHPPLSLEQAARIAALSLEATLRTANRLPVSHHVLAWAGGELPAEADGWRIVPQGDGGLDARLAAAFDACDGPTLLIGMDTPQLRAADLASVFDPRAWQLDAWFGPASDGGFWALGLAEPDGSLIRGVRMSRGDTGERQLARLRGAGLAVGLLPVLTDIDTIEDAEEVAALLPGTALAHELAAFRAGAA